MFPGISPGWRWSGSEFTYSKLWDIEDLELAAPLDIRSTYVVLQDMNSIMPFLNLTAECPSDYSNKRLPTLDCSIFVKDGRFVHSFFKKPTRFGKSLDASTALPKSSMHASLVQEIVRTLISIYPSLYLSIILSIYYFMFLFFYLSIYIYHLSI